jgi:hypothetical protein
MGEGEERVKDNASGHKKQILETKKALMIFENVFLVISDPATSLSYLSLDHSVIKKCNDLDIAFLPINSPFSFSRMILPCAAFDQGVLTQTRG